jgi:hypothetical protein
MGDPVQNTRGGPAYSTRGDSAYSIRGDSAYSTRGDPVHGKGRHRAHSRRDGQGQSKGKDPVEDNRERPRGVPKQPVGRKGFWGNRDWRNTTTATRKDIP